MKILGIDYGRSKVGIAVGDIETELTEPFQVLSISNLKNQISKLIEENKIGKIVIGLPGGKMDEEIKKFGAELQKETSLPIEYFDETLTTQDAQKILIEGGGTRKNRKEKEDAVAAAVMLEYYLETH